MSYPPPQPILWYASGGLFSGNTSRSRSSRGRPTVLSRRHGCPSKEKPSPVGQWAVRWRLGSTDGRTGSGELGPVTPASRCPLRNVIKNTQTVLAQFILRCPKWTFQAHGFRAIFRIIWIGNLFQPTRRSCPNHLRRDTLALLHTLAAISRRQRYRLAGRSVLEFQRHRGATFAMSRY